MNCSALATTQSESTYASANANINFIDVDTNVCVCGGGALLGGHDPSLPQSLLQINWCNGQIPPVHMYGATSHALVIGLCVGGWLALIVCHTLAMTQ